MVLNANFISWQPEFFWLSMDKQTATNWLKTIPYSGQWTDLSTQPYVIICITLCLSIQQLHILNKVQYSADGHAGKVILFHKMMTEIPKT
jgi:hypothetical protein